MADLGQSEGAAQGEALHLSDVVARLASNAESWARTSIAERIDLLQQVKRNLYKIAPDWVAAISRQIHLTPGSRYEGEVWLAGPHLVMAACNGYIKTLTSLTEPSRAGPPHRVRELATGQIAVTVMPSSYRDQLLLPGVRADVWMEPGVTAQTLADHIAGAYKGAPEQRAGGLVLVAGAGNSPGIAPCDCLHQLIGAHRSVLLKMNPINAYNSDYLRVILRPFIDIGALEIVSGGAAEGAFLCDHPDVNRIHITGARKTFDTIVWGEGETGRQNRAKGEPINRRAITAELGGVSPIIVVPGLWSAQDIAFQAEHIATQKLHNAGHNCIAAQILIVSQDWPQKAPLLDELRAVIRRLPPRQSFYPGTDERLGELARQGGGVETIERAGAAHFHLAQLVGEENRRLEQEEVFGPLLGIRKLAHSEANAFLEAAIDYANARLTGNLGASILIHPKTMRQIGRRGMESHIANLKYGQIAINAWSGLNYQLVQMPWGAFPGGTLEQPGSGIGFVHNTAMFDRPQRAVVWAPFRRFPQSLLAGDLEFLPRPPWFVTHKTQRALGRQLAMFEYGHRAWRLPGILWRATLG